MVGVARTATAALGEDGRQPQALDDPNSRSFLEVAEHALVPASTVVIGQHRTRAAIDACGAGDHAVRGRARSGPPALAAPFARPQNRPYSMNDPSSTRSAIFSPGGAATGGVVAFHGLGPGLVPRDRAAASQFLEMGVAHPHDASVKPNHQRRYRPKMCRTRGVRCRLN